jgi:RNA polymerase sigma-70 factor (ECF subfamily)
MGFFDILRLMEQDGTYEALVSGDKKAFRKFYCNTKKKLLAYLQAKVKSPEDAEELLHDTYLSFLDSLPLFQGRSSLKTFLYSIARHEVGDYWRKKYAKKALLTVPFLDQLYTEKLYSTLLLNDEIERVYRKLTEEQVMILRFKYELGFSIGDIAQKLRVSVKAAESKLFRARKAFQEVYVELYGL